MNDKPETASGEPTPKHRATFAKDKRKGGYLIRVAGPMSNRFSGRTVPVTMKAGGQQTETLTDVIWTGKDDDTGEPVTLYHFENKPLGDDEIPF